MTRILDPCDSYRETRAFALTCLIYQATLIFSRRNCNRRTDPLDRTGGQLVGAARSARLNLVAGLTRTVTTKDTGRLLIDIARAHLDELAGDYETFLAECGEVPWSELDHLAESFREVTLDRFEGTADQRHRFGKYLLEMRQRFAGWLENEDALVAANALLIMIDETTALIRRMLGTDVADNAEDKYGAVAEAI